MTKQDKQTMNKTEELNKVVTNKLRDLHYAGLESLELKYIDGIVDLIKQSNREAVEGYRFKMYMEIAKVKGMPIITPESFSEISTKLMEEYLNSLGKGTNNE